MGVIIEPDSTFGTVTVKVPFIEGAEVTFNQDLSVKFMRRFRELIKKENKSKEETAELSKMLFEGLIKDWNFFYKNEAGEEVKIPLTLDGADKYLTKRINDWLNSKIQDFLAGGVIE